MIRKIYFFFSFSWDCIFINTCSFRVHQDMCWLFDEVLVKPLLTVWMHSQSLFFLNLLNWTYHWHSQPKDFIIILFSYVSPTVVEKVMLDTRVSHRLSSDLRVLVCALWIDCMLWSAAHLTLQCDSLSDNFLGTK